jgi:Tetrapyrrole (Corrin/Porphyrin) Methylases
VLYLVADPIAKRWLQRLNPNARSLEFLYGEGKSRLQTYTEMVDEILAPVRAGLDVCAAFYGHPGIFVHATQESVSRARAEGYRAQILPAVSALDCLFADLEIDPGRTGLQSFEATDFLVHGRRPDVTATVVLWQIGVVGELGFATEPSRAGLAVLAEHLRSFYPAEHEAIVYEASPYPVCDPIVIRATVAELDAIEVPLLATLVIPPAEPPRRDDGLVARLGFS